jgi:uncharacterized protein (TIRG00374 family)
VYVIRPTLKKRVLIAIVFSVLIILALIWIANPEKLFDSLGKTNLFYIFIVIILYFVNTITKGVRWYLLVSSTGTHVPLSKTFPFYLIALAFNNLTPGKVGGEPVRAYLLKKEANVPVGHGVASIFAEKIMDIIVITTIAIIGAIFILPRLPPAMARALIAILVLVIIGIIAAIVIVSHSTILKKTVDKSVNLAKKVSNKGFITKLTDALVGFVDTFRFGMSEILKARRTAVSCISLTVMIWINEAIRLYIILHALPDVQGISLGAVFIASSIASILALALPAGSGNLLGIEAVFIAVGMSPSIAGAAGILQVATSLWISVPLGAIAMVITGFSISEASRVTGSSNESNASKGSEISKVRKTSKIDNRSKKGTNDNSEKMKKVKMEIKNNSK